MPGIVVFKRRWSAGSDDLVVPAVFLIILHTIWLITLSVILGSVHFPPNTGCTDDLKNHVLGYLVILGGCILVEIAVGWLSMRGGILDTHPRACMQYLLYIRLALLIVEFVWQIMAMIWAFRNYSKCAPESAEKAVLGIIVCNWCIIFSVIVSLWCTFDTAGRKWVKMKRYQESLRDKPHRGKRSGSARRNWRQRKAIRAYEQSWDRRFRFLCCCVERKGRNRNSMTEIAQLFNDFFRDLDVVPSDVVAGLVLLRRYQKMRMQGTVLQCNNDVYQYISGVPITPRTKFLQLGQPEVLKEYKLVIHYMKFALAAYGWPMYMVIKAGTALCEMMPYLRCSGCCTEQPKHSVLIDDNCCQCNFAALKKISGMKDIDIVYVTYHVDIEETPFYVALDHRYRKVVVCVRGTLSLQDVLTDLKADAETLPLDPPRDNFVAHKGMVQAAIYIQKKLKDENILAQAFERDLEKETDKYQLILVGHSLGAGTAAILAILLKQQYPTLHCYSYSPPGGLVSESCVEETKEYITSVMVGKDVVPRIGLPQMELLRTDILNVIKKSEYPKWKIITKGLCCGPESADTSTISNIRLENERDVTAHPSDSGIGLSAHRPLHPPGKIIHIVRSHPKDKRGFCKSIAPVYQAIWADNTDFSEVLISPTMINDHMPDYVMEALEKVLVNVAPPKPTRKLTELERKELLSQDQSPTPSSSGSPQKFYLETSFNTPLPSDGPMTIVNESNHNLVPGVSWDIAADDSVITLENLETDQDTIFPNPNSSSPKLILDLNNEYVMHAPLASQETLSDISSVCSVGRDNSRISDHIVNRIVPVSQKLETIQHSPIIVTHSNSVQPAINDSHKETMLCQNSIFFNAQNKNDNDVNSIMTHVQVEMTPFDTSQSSADPITSSCHQMRIISDHLLETAEEKDIVKPLGNRKLKLGNSKSSPLTSDKESEENRSSGSYDRHSPDDCNQYGYGNPNECYSAAGIGYYPHGSDAYHPPIKQHKHSLSESHDESKPIKSSQSESYLQQLSAKYTMRRSTEQRDIAHLQDTTQVFERELLGEDKTEPRGCINPVQSMPQHSLIVQDNSPDEELGMRLTSSHSDDVFEPPVEETDV